MVYLRFQAPRLQPGFHYRKGRIMAVTPVRVTGVVLANETRKVTRKSDQAEFTFRTASVLVANKGIIDVSFPEDVALPGEGELVDLLADVTVYSGDPRFGYLSDFAATASLVGSSQ